MKIIFRCPPEWQSILPRPVPAKSALPGWLRAMPAEAPSRLLGQEVRTFKHCPPFIDAMGHGWLMPLAADLKVADGSFAWDWELPPARLEQLPRAPLGLHLSAQADGSPLAQPGTVFIKFSNFWTIEAPPGCSVLFTHPANRLDLPFTTLTGLVDCDGFSHGLVHFPAVWRDSTFSGTVPAGTPVAQLHLVPRAVAAEYGTLEGDHAQQFEATGAALSAPGGYRRGYRAKGRD